MSATPRLAHSTGFIKGVRAYKAPKAVLVWSCIASIVVTIAVGFVWGGWVTGGAATEMADRASLNGQAQLAASICVDRFVTGSDAKAQTASLASAESWRRSDLLRQGGWLTLPGRHDPVPGAADLCVQRILNSSHT